MNFFFRHKLLPTIVSRLSTSAAGMIVGIALARTLGPNSLGSYANLVANASIVGTLLCFGMEIPQNLRAARTPDIAGNLLLLVDFHAACSGVAGCIIWFGMDIFGIKPNSSAVSFGIVVAVLVLNQLTQPVLSGIQRQIHCNITMTALLLLQAVALLVSFYSGIASVELAIIIYAVSLGSLYFLSLTSVFKTRIAAFPYGTAFKDAIGEGKHYILSTFSGIVRLRASIVIMGWYLPHDKIGNYQIMQSITEVLYLVPVTISTYIISSRKSGHDLIREIFIANISSVGITTACVIGISITLPFLVPLIYGEGFELAIQLGPVMLSGSIAFAVAKGISAYLSRLEMARTITWIEISTTVVALVSISILIPQAELVGAAWGFTIASWFGAFCYAFCAIRVRAQGK